jgi:hypothetical protein
MRAIRARRAAPAETESLRVADADDALVHAVRAGNEDARNELLTKYRGFARAKSRSYFMVGADH